MSYRPLARHLDIVAVEVQDELLIHDSLLGKAYCLNPVSARVWQSCDGARTIREISEAATKLLGQPVTEDAVWLALDQFERDSLLETKDEAAADSEGLSRRQVIKNLGIASMVMQPLVSSLILPTAAMAASGLPNNSACTSNGQCGSGSCFESAVCCAAGTTIANPPGTVVNACNFENTCSNPVFGLKARCCSGQTQWTYTNCAAPANPGAGVCTCL